MNDKSSGRSKKLRNVLIGIGIILLFAYAIQVTQVNLREPLEPRRQANLQGLIRDLARPDLFNFKNQTRSTIMSIRMPCPEDISGSQVSIEDRVAVLVPNCASTTQDPLTLSGEGFASNVDVAVLWYPLGAQTRRTLAEFSTNDEGAFEETFTMPDIRESEDPQRLEVVEVIDREITGLSDTTVETLEKILETILMALMASTLGTIIAVPISFLGARNIMSGIGSPLAALMSAIIVIPVGGWIGSQITAFLVDFSGLTQEQPILGLIAIPVIAAPTWLILRIGPPLLDEEQPSLGLQIAYWIRIIIALLLTILSLAFVAQLGIVAGLWLDANLGFLGFVGNFIFVMSDLLRVLLPALAGFITALVAASYASRYGQEAVLRMAERPAQLMTLILTITGTAILVFGILYALNWICIFGICNQLSQESQDLLLTLAIPSIIIGIVAGSLSLLAKPKRLFPVGMVTYTITRTTLNVLRAIEPVIMGFVLVVWVGIGPFAGVLALMLHSIADLGKLFSEQVENIEEGPVEAVTATGASKLQTINFAVVPQIVPHYLAFIFYRWDINVRLSTIIGFVGGGGIGLILFRSTNLTQYRQAAVMVIAIAIVVTLLDTVSSSVRKRII